MSMINIDVTLNDSDPLSLAAQAHALMVRLVSWPGLLCAGSSLGSDGRSMAGRFLITASGRTRFEASELERALRSLPSVAAVELRSDDSRSTRPPQPVAEWLPAAA